MMRILVTGRDGQVASALRASASPEADIIAVGRPDLDLERPETIAPALDRARPDIVISAAAYTAVDQAESEPERAFAINAEGAGVLAETAARLSAPILHLSTDYVFDGAKAAPYREDDPCDPQGVYGASKLEGERRMLAASADAIVVRTAWVYAPIGKNFVRTMLRLARDRDAVSVVADQHGVPTYAPDIAEGLLAMADGVLSGRVASRGVYHLAAGGEATWADFAEAIFQGSAARGGPAAAVRRIASVDYPTPARRPANSRLNVEKLAADFGVRLRPWRSGLDQCLDALKASGEL